MLALGIERVGVNRQLAIGVWNPVGPHDHCRHCWGRRCSPRLIWSPIAVERRLLPRLRRRALDRSLHLHQRRIVARHLLGGGRRGKPWVGGGWNGILANVSELVFRRMSTAKVGRGGWMVFLTDCWLLYWGTKLFAGAIVGGYC